VIVAVPAEAPDTTPVAEPTPATTVLLLLHVPPVVASAKVIAEPTQMLVRPVIAEGKGLTVTTRVAKQPVESVYVIITVPAEKPVTTPEAGLTEATDGLLLVHVPPVVASASVVDDATHTVAVPVIAAGTGLTVIG